MIVLGIVGILWIGYSIMLLATISTLIFDDDALATSLEEVSVFGLWNVVAFSTLLLGFILQLYAALGYYVSVLCCVVVILLFNCVWDISFSIVVTKEQYGTVGALDVAILIFIDVIKYGVFVYPVVGLISEIKRGIMRKETYPREAYSCCCQPNPIPDEQQRVELNSEIDRSIYCRTNIV